MPIPEASLQHSEFVSAWKAGRLQVDVDRAKALQVVGSPGVLPDPFRRMHLFLTVVWILSVPAALAIMYFYKWWAGLIVLLAVTPALGVSTKKSAMRRLIERAVQDSAFYDYAVENGIIHITQKG